MKHAFTLSCKRHCSASSSEPSQRAFGLKSCHARAFTLAEVLLTLAIIGVVAALTIPAVVTKVTKEQYVTGLKKAYNTLKTAQRAAEMEHGPMENWDWAGTAEETFKKYFKPYFDILKDCGVYNDDTSCFSCSFEMKYLNGKRYAGDDCYTRYYRFITSDGIAYVFNPSYYTYFPGENFAAVGYIWVDVNGKKGPNVWGIDIFEFDIFRKAGIKPCGSLYTWDGTNIPSSEVDADCSTSEDAGNEYCATKVLAEGAMNYEKQQCEEEPLQ